jgi:glycosyltransferase involved in cell wall biosynthesis
MSHSEQKPAMRIAFVTPEYVTETYFSGGLANYLHRVAKALVTLGHTVHLIVLSEIDNREFQHEGVYIHRMCLAGDCSLRWFNRVTRHRLTETALCLKFSLRAYQKLQQLHQQSSLDLVQFPDWNASGLISGLWRLPIPWVTRTSSYRRAWYDTDGGRRNLDQRLMEWLEWLQMRLSPHIFAPSYLLKQLLAKAANIHSVQVIRSPSYLESTVWDDSIVKADLQGKSYLLFFGRFQITKGFHILAQALPEIFKEHPDCHAVLVGTDMESSFTPSMQAYARSLCHAYADRLIILKPLPHTQLYPLIAGAKLVVLPSLIDNLPNACLEAMALGKPVVGTIGASFEEMIVDGETGFLVPANNIDALSAKLQEVWLRPDLQQIGAAAKLANQAFSVEQTTQQLLNYYKEVIYSTP